MDKFKLVSPVSRVNFSESKNILVNVLIWNVKDCEYDSYLVPKIFKNGIEAESYVINELGIELIDNIYFSEEEAVIEFYELDFFEL